MYKKMSDTQMQMNFKYMYIKTALPHGQRNVILAIIEW